MREALKLKCRCGTVRGQATDLSPRTGIHVVCYCRDCQAFARFLAAEGLLDAAGGAEIFQITPAQVVLEAGQEQLRCMRLSDKGLLRWYVDCCRTPVANTMDSPKVPFSGLLVPFLDADAGTRARVLGPVVVRLFGRDATGPTPPGTHEKAPLTAIPRILWLLGRGLVGRRAQPSPFFAPGAKLPRVTPKVLTPEERAALGPV
ncbi:DUF6151 family protein [Nannocystis punicea]|uniref:DUF6151 family protein n=1 Tax=Nannocystis punicea TaxID=2995304 RepID=A0ABY7HJ85_9BACT|nr:DUF6151 family protein [Nannocystis poenicansa]WAS99168.1 DUF6151 family protein [Nannocystis poenicansa]